MSLKTVRILPTQQQNSRKGKQNQYCLSHHQLNSPLASSTKQQHYHPRILLLMQTQPDQPYVLQQQNKQHRSSCTDIHNFTFSSNFNKNTHYNSGKGVNRTKAEKKLKTASNVQVNESSNKENREEFMKSFYNPTREFIRFHKPLLENRKIIFNTKNRTQINRTTFIGKNFETIADQGNKQAQKQSNIDKLKREIMELDKEDFVSYRSKTYSNTEEAQIIQNEKINKYNHQNSMIVQWKGKTYYKPVIARPSSTVAMNIPQNGLNNIGTPVSLGSYKGFSSVPKKYFSKPKAKYLETTHTIEICGNKERSKQKPNHIRMRMKTQQIAIGLNMFRGKLYRKKINSTFQVY